MWNAVVARPLDHEVRPRLVRAGDLRPDAGIGGRERTVGQARVEGADRAVERFGALRIDRVVETINPFDIGTKAHIAGKIDDRMDVYAAGTMHRIDQSLEWTAG